MKRYLFLSTLVFIAGCMLDTTGVAEKVESCGFVIPSVPACCRGGTATCGDEVSTRALEFDLGGQSDAQCLLDWDCDPTAAPESEQASSDIQTYQECIGGLPRRVGGYDAECTRGCFTEFDSCGGAACDTESASACQDTLWECLDDCPAQSGTILDP